MTNRLTSPRIEMLFSAGCPHGDAAEELVVRVTQELEVEGDVQRVFIETPEDADRARFLGSPSIRVNGQDIEPGADRRTDFSYSCRVYQTPHGVAGLPDEAWLRRALASANGEPAAPGG
jgi:hypothetical protein